MPCTLAPTTWPVADGGSTTRPQSVTAKCRSTRDRTGFHVDLHDREVGGTRVGGVLLVEHAARVEGGVGVAQRRARRG